MKIVELFEELNEFEPKPYESKKAEIAHLRKKLSSIAHKRAILYQSLMTLYDKGIIFDDVRKSPSKDKLVNIPYSAAPETKWRTYHAPEGLPEATKFGNMMHQFEAKEKLLKDRIKDLTVRGSTYCFTGFRSAELEQKIEKQGGRVVSSAINGLNYLVAADPHSNSGKMFKAKTSGCKVISKAELENFLRD